MARTRYCPSCLTTFQDEPGTCPNLGCRSSSPDPWPTLLEPGDLLDRTYKIEAVLAGGAAGMTYRARELGDGDVLVGPELAIKVLYAQRDSGPFVDRLATEARILQRLSHPAILECRGFVHRLGRAPYLITRFEAGGTLHQHVSRVGPVRTPIAARMLLQVVDGLRVAHAVDVVHRDLKPANVLLRRQVPGDEVPDLKIADFGIAKVQGSLGGLTRVGAFVGTPEYAAPEQLLGTQASAATDLFAAAGILWFLLTGEQPLRITQRHDPLHTHDEVVAQIPPQLPREVRATEAGLRLQAVIDGLMVEDPDARWDASRVLDALEDAAEADGAGALPRPEPSVGTGGTLFVDDDPATFVWGGEEPGAPAGPKTPTLVAPPPGDTVLEEEAPAAARPDPAPAPRRAAPSDSTMEGLFDFAPSVGDPMGGATPPPAAPSEDAPPPSTSLFDEALSGPVSTPSGGDTKPSTGDADVVRPTRAPVSLPTDPMDLLGHLGSDTHPDAVLDRLRTWDPGEAATWLRQARRHPDPTTRAGVMRALVALERDDLVSLTRSLLRDPIASVRASAATTLGHLGSGSLLPTLARQLTDSEAEVRKATASALAEAWLRDGDTARGASILREAAGDPDEDVREAVRAGLRRLGSG